MLRRKKQQWTKNNKKNRVNPQNSPIGTYLKPKRPKRDNLDSEDVKPKSKNPHEKSQPTPQKSDCPAAIAWKSRRQTPTKNPFNNLFTYFAVIQYLVTNLIILFIILNLINKYFYKKCFFVKKKKTNSRRSND